MRAKNGKAEKHRGPVATEHPSLLPDLDLACLRVKLSIFLKSLPYWITCHSQQRLILTVLGRVFVVVVGFFAT